MMGYGYENAAGDRISALIDMINGGGPGRSGGTFEGGGILSLLANAVAKPYGSVRERPGHTPMGATAAPVEVVRPVATEGVETYVLPAAEERLALPGLAETRRTPPPPPYQRLGGSPEEDYRGAIFRPTFSPAATGGRRFTAEDRALLPSLHPDLAALFSETKVGELLSPQQAMFLDAARVGSTAAAPAPPPTAAADGTRSISGPPTPVPGPMQGPPIPVPTVPESPPSLGFTAEEFRNLSPAMRNAALLQFTEDLGQMRP